MADTDIQTGLRLYPANNGPSNTALGRDQEVYSRRMVHGENHVQTGGDLTTSPTSHSVTLQAFRAFIDGRQVIDTSDGSFTFDVPASATRYIAIDRAGRLFLRDTDTFTADTEMVLWTVVTDATGVTSKTKRFTQNQFSEVGLDSDKPLYLNKDRTVKLEHQAGDGRVHLTGDFQPDRVVGLPTPTAPDEAATKAYADGATPADASTTTKGITKLSVAPASPTNPIAAGDNDPRLSDARAPTAHAATHKGDGADPIADATDSVAGLMPSADKTKLDAATAAATVDALVKRNASGQAAFADPTADDHAATKAYVDSVAQGLDAKDSVRAATTAALPAHTRTANVLTASANGAFPAQDDVALALNDRLLVKDEGSGTHLENGIYYLSQVGDASNPWTLTRADDANEDADVTAGMFVFVAEGTTNADTGWVLTTNDAITVNTTALAFTQFSGAGQVVAGDGLTKSGNQLDVAVDGSTLEIVGDALQQKDGGTTNAKLADMAQATIKGRAGAAGTGPPQDLTPGQLETILGVDPAVTANTIPKRDASGRMKAGASVAADDVVIRQEVDAGGSFAAPVTYGAVDVTQAYANGQILAQGFLTPQANFTNPSFLNGPPGITIPPTGATGALHGYLFGNATDDGAGNQVGRTIALGTKTHIKGRFIAYSDTRLDTGYEKWGIGIYLTAYSPPTTYLGAAAETTRDDVGTVAVTVDNSENIQYYNNENAGDASYTDSGFDADLSVGIYWEMILEMASTATNINQLKVTIKIDGNVILNEAVPVASSTATYQMRPVFLVNVNGINTDMVYKVEKVA